MSCTFWNMRRRKAAQMKNNAPATDVVKPQNEEKQGSAEKTKTTKTTAKRGAK